MLTNNYLDFVGVILGVQGVNDVDCEGSVTLLE